MDTELLNSRILQLKAHIRKKEQDAGWYGGVSGTEFYNRDWKKDITKAKRELRALEQEKKSRDK